MAKDSKVIHIVGAQETNFPWGVECRIIRALEALGHTVISTDFRKNRERLPQLLGQKADLAIVCRGEMIPPELIEAIPSPSALWYAELLGTRTACDDDAKTRRSQFAYNSRAFDYVFVHDASSVEVCHDLGCRNVHWVTTAAVDPTINKRFDLPKKYDVTFVGSVTERRKIFLNTIQGHFNLHIAQVWNQDALNVLYNESKIVLNIHLSNLMNTEVRLCEVLGAGAFQLTEELSMKDFLVDGKHLGAFRHNSPEDCVEKIAYYLRHEEGREAIAAEGHRYVHEKHTYVHRMKELLSHIDFGIEKRLWPGFALGIPFDAQGIPTRNLSRFYEAIDTNLPKIIHLPARIEKRQSPRPSEERRKLRIFAAFAHVNWEDQNLMPALESFGEVVRYRWDFNAQYAQDWHTAGKIAMNAKLIEAVEAAHREKPIDVFFGYLSGRTAFPGIVRAIGTLGIPTLNISLDDKTKFFGGLELTGFTGTVDIANAFTLCWTSTEDAVKQYATVGARAIYLPEGANPDVYKVLPGTQHDIDVSFIGQCYGQRPQIIEHLRKKGIHVQALGRGWPSGEISVAEMVKTYNRSRINLGFAAVGNSAQVCCLKGRDFEVPMSGGLYLTQYHPELENVYDIGKEILCYRDLDDLAEKIRFCLLNPGEAARIREAGHRRALQEHTWKMRFETAFRAIGILTDEDQPSEKMKSAHRKSWQQSGIEPVNRTGETLEKEIKTPRAGHYFPESDSPHKEPARTSHQQ